MFLAFNLEVEGSNPSQRWMGCYPKLLTTLAKTYGLILDKWGLVKLIPEHWFYPEMTETSKRVDNPPPFPARKPIRAILYLIYAILWNIGVNTVFTPSYDFFRYFRII